MVCHLLCDASYKNLQNLLEAAICKYVLDIFNYVYVLGLDTFLRKDLDTQ